MKKQIVAILLTLSLLILPGCSQEIDNEELFRRSFKQLQKQTALHVRNEQYFGKNLADIKLLAVRDEWRSGENFYWESADADQFLCYNQSYWTIQPNRHTQWKRHKNPISSFSDWWNDYSCEQFLEAEVTFRKEGKHIVLEQRKDHGFDNCTVSRQISTNTFYMTKDGQIVRITLMTVTYNGTEADPEEVHSVDKQEYYITPVDANVAEEKIMEQYRTVSE